MTILGSIFYGGMGKAGNLLIILLLVCINFALQAQQYNKSRCDTIYRDTTINGKKFIIQQIILYDTLFSAKPIKKREQGLLFSPREISFHGPNVKPIFAPTVRKYEMEYGFSYHQGYRPVLGSSLRDFQGASRTIKDFGTFFNVTAPFSNWYARSGAGLKYTQEKTWYNLSFQDIDTSYNYIPYTIDSSFIDTAYFLDVSQLPDTVYIMHIDTFNFTVHDTIVETMYDTTTGLREFEQVNRFFYVEIPILIGYNIPLKNLNIGFETGMYVNWLAQVRGRTIDKSYGIRQLDEKYFHRVTVDLAFRIRFKYYLNGSSSFTLTPDFRYSLYDLYRNNEFATRKILRYGLVFGYIFN